MSQQLPRVMRLRDVVLFNISAIVGLRWLTTAASQFGLASLGLWLLAMVVFFLPSAIAVRELADLGQETGSEEHTAQLQARRHLAFRLPPAKKGSRPDTKS